MKSAIAKISFHLQWWVIAAVLCFATVAFGGVHETSLYGIRLLIVFSLILQALICVCQNESFNDFLPSVIFPFVAFGAFCALIAIQYFSGLQLLEGTVIGSINPWMTQNSFVQLIVYFSFFIVCLPLVSNAPYLKRLAFVIAMLVFAITILGLVQRLAGEERILWKNYVTTRSIFFGPFVNKNHFGGFLCLTFPLVLGLLHNHFYQLKREFHDHFQQRPWWMKVSAFLNSGIVFLFFLIVMTLAACFFSLAKAASIVLLFCCSAYFLSRGVSQRKIGFYLILFVILAGSFLLLGWLGGAFFTEHFKMIDFANSWTVRMHVFRQSLSLFYAFPFFGTGLGTYPVISSKVVSYLINYFSWDHVHNDYLELLTDTGWVGFLFFMAALLSMILISTFRDRRNLLHWNQFMIQQAVIAMAGISVLEFFDFHLKIPAVALFFVLQLAILFRCSRPLAPAAAPQFLALRWVLPCFYVVLAAALLFFSTRQFWAYRLSSAQTDRMSHLKQAVQIDSQNPELWYQLGKEYRAQIKNVERIDRVSTAKNALAALRKAVVLSPADAHYWYYLGMLAYSMGHRAEGVASLEEAVRWAPARFKYSICLLAVYLKESDRSDQPNQKAQFSNQARQLYERLQQLDPPPNKDHYRNWMGDDSSKLAAFEPSIR